MSITNNPDRVTRIISDAANDPNRVTQIQNDPARTTSIMRDTDPSRVTSILQSQPNQAASLLDSGTKIGNYSVVRAITENTGEATLLLATDSNRQYVLKIYHKGLQPKQELRARLNDIRNPHVMSVIKSSTWNERYYEVLPFYEEGDLGSAKDITADVIKKIIVPGVNDGLNALHTKHIVHRDIKPSNIFFEKNHSNVVIGDFGISSVLSTDMSVRATGMARTLGYAAPETSTGFISKESDYYSFGVTLLHIVLGKDPFEGMTDMQILFQTVNEGLNIPTFVDTDIATLIEGLTIKDRNLRWGYNEVRAWVRGDAPALPKRGDIRKTLSGKAARPYRFANQYFTSLTELERAFARDWTNAKKHLYRGLIENYLKEYGEDLASDCMDLKEMGDKDAAVFRLLYLLDPNAPLNWQGIEYGTVQNLSRYMFKAYPDSVAYIKPMICNGSLRFYLDKHQQLSPDLNDKLRLYEKHKTISNESFLMIAYILNPMRGYRIGETLCHTLEEAAAYLTNSGNCDSECGQLMDDIKFWAWVRSLGYETQVVNWREMQRKEGWNT